MRILHIVTSLGDGGLEKLVYLIISNLSTEKFDHHIAILKPDQGTFLKDDLLLMGVKMVEFNLDNRFHGISSIYRNITGLFRLSSYIKVNNIEIIHSHDFFPAFISRISALLTAVFRFYRVKKIIITLHNSFFWLNNYHHKINKLFSYFTTKIICVSESVMNYSMQHDKISKDKYKIIYNGVSIDQYVPNLLDQKKYRDEFGILPEEMVIANVGVLSVRKGQKYLIEAFNRLLCEGYNLKLLIFGSERDHEKEIAEEIYGLIRKYNLADRVKIIQPRKDLNLIYNIFDVYVMPSITEGLSLSAMEAMLMERICLFSDIAPFQEMVEENVNGFLFKSEDIDDLHKKLKYILNNIESLKNIGTLARKTAVKKYDVKNMCKEYEKLYLE